MPRMRSLAASLITLAALATSAFAADPAPSVLSFPADKDTISVPLAHSHESLCVQVKVDGQPAGYYILDTGSSRSVIHPPLADKLKLPVLGAASVLGASGRESIRYREAHSLNVGGVTLSNPAFLEKDLAKSVYNLNNLPIKGILGNDFLGRLPYTLDFQTATLTLHRPGSFTPPKDAHAFPLETILDCPSLPVRIDDKVEGFFLLDTGAEGVNLTPLGVRLFSEIERQPGTSLVFSSGIGGMEVMLRSPIDIQYLAHRGQFAARFSLHKPVGGNDSPQIGRIGYEAFQDARLTIDIPAGKIYAEWLTPLTVDAWLKAAGDPKKPDLFGYTPLARAALENRLDVAQAILDAGANPSATDFYGNTALFAAAQNGNLELVDLLLKHGAFPDVVKKGLVGSQVETPLQAAAQCGFPKIVAALLKAGASAEGNDPFGRSPLQQAAMAGHNDCVKLLLAAGASPNRKIPNLNLTPLHVACIFGHTAVIESLLAAKADLATQDSEGNSPLHIAGFNKRDAAAAILLNAKAEVDARNNNGQTPLMAAALNGSAPMVRLLLAAGADPAAKDRGGKSVFQYATDFGDTQVLKLLAAALNPPTTEPASQP